LGFDSNVNIVFERGILAPAGTTVVRACVEHRCGETQETPAKGLRVAVIIPSMPGDADVHVSVKVTHNSRVIFLPALPPGPQEPAFPPWE
jgi:hypothetical protein